MSETLQFTVGLDDVRDTRRLQQRPLIIAMTPTFLVVGLGLWWLTESPGGLIVVALALLLLAEWWFAPLDHWFDRRRPIVGSRCEIDLDDGGIAYRQSSIDGAWTTSGRIEWSAVRAIREDARVLLILGGGRSALVAIPKSAFASSEASEQFRAVLTRHTGSGSHREPPGRR